MSISDFVFVNYQYNFYKLIYNIKMNNLQKPLSEEQKAHLNEIGMINIKKYFLE